MAFYLKAELDECKNFLSYLALLIANSSASSLPLFLPQPPAGLVVRLPEKPNLEMDFAQ